jgi:NAD-dependent dihydropyrimidine dehydrogenase PreA subunit
MNYLANVTTLRYLPDQCAGCGSCVEVCPHGVFRMQGKRAVVIDRDRCMECGACSRNCEFGAISVASGVGCASGIIWGMITGGEPTCGCADQSGGCC